MAKSGQTEGRKANAAQPPGERRGLISKSGTQATGAKSRVAAGPDGPDAGVVGAALKGKK